MLAIMLNLLGLHVEKKKGNTGERTSSCSTKLHTLAVDITDIGADGVLLKENSGVVDIL